MGHVDCGKTTLTQALIESGEEKKQPTSEPQHLNLPFKYAWVLERLRCTGCPEIGILRSLIAQDFVAL